ncbi:fish-egg lectin-like [Lissotriton helveticus]
MKALLLLAALLLLGTNADPDCVVVPGKLKQIDAGAGAVYGVGSNGTIWRWDSSAWVNVPGEAIHASVGPAGVWCVNKVNFIYKLQDNNWVQVAGLLKQIDAGGNKLVVGANFVDAPYCLSEAAVLARPPTPAWVYILGLLKYYSCGLWGCWGVNSGNAIYYRSGTSSGACAGTTWTNVAGSLSMIEVGADGSVYGVNAEGTAYQREGVTNSNPMGTQWKALDFCSKIKHVTFDSGALWLINEKEEIYRCSV